MSGGVHIEQSSRGPFDVVCLAASLGGVQAYGKLLARLPATFPAPVVLVQHRPADAEDRFVAVLGRRSALPVVPLASGRPLRPGTVHVVPGRTRAVFDDRGQPWLRQAEGHRVADELFASAAKAFGPRVLAAVLTGRLDDGAKGVRNVKGAGGRVLAQDEATCGELGFQMPAAAIATGCVDFVLPLEVLADALTALVMVPGAAGMMRVALPSWARVVTPRPAYAG
ncbi:Chemotaxis response regulator protein-glutamate methylesterase CheB [[Actinomadura] parvosata subsp. kistnae]|uniref:chemotaxis protein CheB n=1 Tax=[Actinomadura] parvosata TaxID=1955412 RepID=UPI000D291AF7|nr:chemotaxis protein CheB [Nonomuraea sp. ATCC 55076]SPL96882.1 Chemotaxis response regulator protein-glutamate methylesterase CheB [Actinomadura parvosata subsp. kistnae]